MTGEECLRLIHARTKYRPNLQIGRENFFVYNLIHSLPLRDLRISFHQLHQMSDRRHSATWVAAVFVSGPAAIEKSAKTARGIGGQY